jgi:hypothetical protein
MNCDLACHLIDDYLEKRLSRYLAQRLEHHLSECSNCSRELRDRPRFERTIRKALSASVQQQHLSAEASMRIVREAQGSVRRGIWSKRVNGVVRVAASIAAMCLVFVGLFYLLKDISPEPDAEMITVFPIRYLSVPGRPPASRLGLRERIWPDELPADPSSAASQMISLDASDVVIEPWMLKPGEMFTITLSLRTNMPQPADSARFDLDVSGPTGYYRFEMKVRGHLPSRGISVLQVTPGVMEASSREKYLLSPAEIFQEPGVYTLSIFLYSPLRAPAR